MHGQTGMLLLFFITICETIDLFIFLKYIYDKTLFQETVF